MRNIRLEVRKKRRALTPRQQQLASERVAHLICSQPFFLRAKRLGFYLANDGEINPSSLLDIALAAGKKCFLPVLHPLRFNRLYFAEYTPSTLLVPNRFGILEPDLKTSPIVPAWSLDHIFLPLVGFDRFGSRLGMGGGFYDRTLAFKHQNKQHSPKLIGLAHCCQEIDKIQRQNWDIPLNLIITNREIICAKRK